MLSEGRHKVSTEVTNWNNVFATYLTDKRFIGIPINQQKKWQKNQMDKEQEKAFHRKEHQNV